MAAKSISEWAASDRIASDPVESPTTPLASVSPADAAIEESATFCLAFCMLPRAVAGPGAGVNAEARSHGS